MLNEEEDEEVAWFHFAMKSVCRSLNLDASIFDGSEMRRRSKRKVKHAVMRSLERMNRIRGRFARDLLDIDASSMLLLIRMPLS